MLVPASTNVPGLVAEPVPEARVRFPFAPLITPLKVVTMLDVRVAVAGAVAVPCTVTVPVLNVIGFEPAKVTWLLLKLIGLAIVIGAVAEIVPAVMLSVPAEPNTPPEPSTTVPPSIFDGPVRVGLAFGSVKVPPPVMVNPVAGVVGWADHDGRRRRVARAGIGDGDRGDLPLAHDGLARGRGGGVAADERDRGRLEV